MTKIFIAMALAFAFTTGMAVATVIVHMDWAIASPPKNAVPDGRSQ